MYSWEWLGQLRRYAFYRLALPTPGITFLQADNTAKVIDKRVITSGPVRLIRKGGQELPENVYVSSAYIWNSGNVSLRDSAILQPVFAVAAMPIEVLEVRLVGVTRPDVTQITLENSGSRVGVHWKILEPGDGARIQIIYTSDQAGILSLKGIVEGVRGFNIEDAPNGYVSLHAAFHAAKIMQTLFLLLLGLAAIGEAMQWIGHRAGLDSKPWAKRSISAISFCVIVALVLAVYYGMYTDSRRALIKAGNGSVPAVLLQDSVEQIS